MRLRVRDCSFGTVRAYAEGEVGVVAGEDERGSGEGDGEEKLGEAPEGGEAGEKFGG